MRARAITLIAAATQSVDATAQAMGVDAQTARHYLDAKKTFDGSAILRAAQAAFRGTAKCVGSIVWRREGVRERMRGRSIRRNPHANQALSRVPRVGLEPTTR